jgi:hypothetical protein
VSGSLQWVVVWNDADGREHRDRSRTRYLALNAACDLIAQHHTVRRIDEGRNGLIIRREVIERYCRDRAVAV